MEKERKLNFELLRIFSMILIVIYHYSDWGKIMFIENNAIARIIGDFMNIGGKLGVNLFVLISGYFLIESKFKTKKLIKLMLQVWLYSVGISVLCYILNIGDKNPEVLIHSLLPIIYNVYWFVTAYVVMYFLSPFINKMINNIQKEQHKLLLIILGVLLSIIPTILKESNICMSDLTWFIYLYLVAAYIKKYNIEFIKNKNIYLLISMGIVIFLFVVSAFCYKFRNIMPSLVSSEVRLNIMNSLPMLVLSLCTFMYFKNITIKQNKVIEFCAKGVFAVYLIQMHPAFRRYLFDNILKIQNFMYVNPIILVTYVLITSILFFIIGILIDTLRQKLIEKHIFKIKKFDNLFNKIDEKINM